MKKTALSLLLLAACATTACTQPKDTPPDRVVVAYVTSWSDDTPDPRWMTHINYAFGHVTETFDGVGIDNPARLRQMVQLKKTNPDLCVLLSIGGWGSGRFSEMAADDSLRRAFARDCLRIVEEFGLDGIDIDWEYPTVGTAGISFHAADTENYTLLMRDLREELGAERLLTLASSAGAGYIDFAAIAPLVDFVNIMSYDMGGGATHHSALYRSPMTGGMSCDEAVEAHLRAGLPAEKLTLGLPFYGRGSESMGDFADYHDIIRLEGYTEQWDTTACAPYLTNADGESVCTFDNARSLRLKCDYLKAKGLRGAMYWDYSGDDAESTLRRTVWERTMEEAD